MADRAPRACRGCSMLMEQTDGALCRASPGRWICREYAGDLSIESLGVCETCEHQVLREDDRPACRLIDGGKPCSFAAALRAGGPWPSGCPRSTMPITTSAIASTPRRPSPSPCSGRGAGPGGARQEG